jgi:hypothetical protein
VWPELKDAQSGIDNDEEAGRFYWLPFLYSQYSNWRNISRILAMFHSTLIKTANRPYVTDSDVTDLNRAVIKVSSGENLTPLEVPTMPAEALKLLQTLTDEVDRASYAPAAYGAKAGTSGAQQDQNYQAGSIRMDTLRAEAERVTAKALKTIGYSIIEGLKVPPCGQGQAGSQYRFRQRRGCLEVQDPCRPTPAKEAVRRTLEPT